MGMPWTIPNLVLQAKPVPLANMRTHGRRHVFVNCGNPDCYHNAELDVSGLPDNVTFGELLRRMLCTVCDHRGPDIGRPGCIMADWAAPPDRTPIRHCLFAAAQIDSSPREDGKCPLLVIEKASPFRTATRGRSAFG
jgi:hypothetical protein